MEALQFNKRNFHHACFKCTGCGVVEEPKTVKQLTVGGPLLCKLCFHKTGVAPKRVQYGAEANANANAPIVPKKNALAARFGTNQKCPQCLKTAYKEESESLNGILYHKACMQCRRCSASLSLRQLVVIDMILHCKICQREIVNHMKVDMTKHPKAFVEYDEMINTTQFAPNTWETGDGEGETSGKKEMPGRTRWQASMKLLQEKKEQEEKDAAEQRQRPRPNKLSSPFLNNTGYPEHRPPEEVPEPASPPNEEEEQERREQAEQEEQEEQEEKFMKKQRQYEKEQQQLAARPGPNTSSSVNTDPAEQERREQEEQEEKFREKQRQYEKQQQGDKQRATVPAAAAAAAAAPSGGGGYRRQAGPSGGTVDRNKEGSLIKAAASKGKDVCRNKWKPRQFSIQGEQCKLVYKAAGSNKVAGEIDLRGAKCLVGNVFGKPTVFKVCAVDSQFGTIYYYLKARNTGELADWMASINAIINSPSGAKASGAKEGTLVKAAASKGADVCRNKWTSRQFAIQGSKLVYKVAGSNKVLGAIELEGAECVLANVNTKPKDTVFKVEAEDAACGTIYYYLNASSPQDAADWMAAIRAVINSH